MGRCQEVGMVAMGHPGRVSSLRLLVVDDHRTFADLLRLALDGTDDLECAGTAHTVAEAREFARSLRPDVILMDIQLGSSNSLGLIRELTDEFPEVRVIVLTAVADRHTIRAASAAGACGLLAKDGSLPEVLDAVRNAPRGGFTVSPELLNELVSLADPNRPRPRFAPLTARELEVLRLLANGHDAQRISAALGLTINTCRGYIKNILAKLDVHSQLQAVSVAIRDGMIEAPATRAR